MKVTNKYVFFWGGIFSNFYQPCNILFIGKTFNCSEQLFMWFKAKEFNDDETAKKILNANTPKEAKKLGRQVKGFNDEQWDKVKTLYMEIACRLKFKQNPTLLNELLKYKSQTFVEASPYDGVWGVKMAEDADGIEDESEWQGQNLLGKVLTKIRDEFLH